MALPFIGEGLNHGSYTSAPSLAVLEARLLGLAAPFPCFVSVLLRPVDGSRFGAASVFGLRRDPLQYRDPLNVRC